MGYSAYQQFSPRRWPGTQPAPVGWEVRRLKFAVTCNDEALSEGTDPDYEMRYVDISSVNLVQGITTIETLSFEEAPSRARRIVRDGDTIISTVRTYLRAIAAIKGPPDNMIVSTGFAVVRPLQFIDSRFLGYALQGAGFIDAVVANSTGVSYPAINPSKLVCLPFAYPEDITEQQQIAAFLDWKTGQIDALIARKQELLKKLKEKRIVAVTQAVTRGLNPAAPLRDSGIAWLGQVPRHWQVMKLHHMVRMRSGSAITSVEMDDDGEYPVFGGNGVRGRFSEFTHEGNYVLIGRQGAECGNINYAHGKFWASEHAVVATPDRELDYRWLGETLRAMNLNQYSQAAAQPGLSVEVIGRLKMPFPPVGEQVAIADSLAAGYTKFNPMLESISEAVNRLIEYRTALITAATSGKIDVHKVKLPQPAA